MRKHILFVSTILDAPKVNRLCTRCSWVLMQGWHEGCPPYQRRWNVIHPKPVEIATGLVGWAEKHEKEPYARQIYTHSLQRVDGHSFVLLLVLLMVSSCSMLFRLTVSFYPSKRKKFYIVIFPHACCVFLICLWLH